ncbi:MAG: hypothetical protein KAS39_02115, partial [Actinomycetia bacterium]|nr:hypothetical protein [Actinomycetes bacterium]
IRYPRGKGLGVKLSKKPKMLEVGKSETIRAGKDIAIYAVGRFVDIGLKTADRLRGKGYNATVINARFIKPVDEHLIEELSETHKLIVIMEDNSVIGGFGDAVLEVLAKKGILINTLNLGIPDNFITHGAVKDLFNEIGLTEESMADKIERKAEELGINKYIRNKNNHLSDKKVDSIK